MANNYPSHNLAHAVNKTESYPKGEADGSHLSGLEREWLDRIPFGWAMSQGNAPLDYMNDTRTPGEKAANWTPARLSGETVVIVWRGEFGIDMGAVRGKRASAGQLGYTEDIYEASPFPGAWVPVAVSQILLVRHAETI